MKKILAMLLALVMVLSLAACGGEKAPEAPKAEEPKAEEPAATEPAKKGCGSVIGFSAVAIMAAAAAAVALKKKD